MPGSPHSPGERSSTARMFPPRFLYLLHSSQEAALKHFAGLLRELMIF